ncbi:PQQ-binding-like beta-propeller repeat protein [Streptomyces sp. NPDC101160]|uniref:protein kinase domain-containing protein n=1 Tax=Streptomyces sp. NPDC101160 TaxID=3366118 RepID=UPI00382CC876
MPPLRGTGVGREAEDPEYAGEYRLGAVLGSGGMGIVRLARSASGLRLAVKIVHATYASDPEFRARFRQEVTAARRVSGAFTAPVVDADPDAPRPWMATLYVPGPTLAEQVKRNGPLSPAELRRLTAGLAEALRDIHRAGVVHRDLKPGNVLLTDSGPKVIDFGISRPADSDLHTETGKLIGSPPFMAPEQFQRPRQVGPAADVFALGSVLVHAATGRGPFDSDSPYIVAYQVVHDEPDLTGVPEELAPLVARCLAKEPAERPTPDEVMAALLPPSYEAAAFIPAQRRASSPMPAVAGDTDTRALRASGVDSAATTVPRAEAVEAPRRSRRRPLAVVAAAVLAALTAGGVLLAVQLGGSEGEERAQRTAASRPLDVWRTALPGAGAAAPVCAVAPYDGALFCAARGTTAVARLDAGTGKQAWSVPSRGDGTDAVAPVLAGGRLGTVSGDRYTTYDPRTGRPGWSADMSAYFADPLAAGDTLLLGSPSGTFTALDGATGRRLWQHPLRGNSAPQTGPYDPATGLVHVFEASADGAHTLVTSVRARSGEVVHQHRLPGNLVAGATGADGTLFLTSQGFQGRTGAVVRHDPARGTTNRVPLPFSMEDPRIAAHGTAVYLLDHTGALVAVDTAGSGGGAGGRTLWQLETSAGHVSQPVLSADGTRLYFSAADGRLFAVDTARGTVLGQTEPRLHDGRLGFTASVPTPVVTGDRVYGTAPDGSVFAVDGRDPAHW